MPLARAMIARRAHSRVDGLTGHRGDAKGSLERRFYCKIGKRPPFRAIGQYLFADSVDVGGDIATACDAASTLRGRDGVQVPVSARDLRQVRPMHESTTSAFSGRRSYTRCYLMAPRPHGAIWMSLAALAARGVVGAPKRHEVLGEIRYPISKPSLRY
jgi:hypothetical protein